jgi:hypothetical protein
MLNILLLVGLCGLIFYYLTFVFRRVELTGYSLQLAALYPLISIILTFMAYRAIRRDEQLVRSADTIR